ncbi:hypothetical protein GpartN1_g4182.t1 [Galdieria partita]|uniref:Uncharacterized protein n=1 Tax=Galdieria partita TaxID=83374 RepID=A0A9C7PYT6_9RHOD|nr:hypothetical protein GpartN1_g4182.t1 [Galdieria partita]
MQSNANQWFVLYTGQKNSYPSLNQKSCSLFIPSCGVRLSSRGHLLCFFNTCLVSHNSPLETGDLKVGFRSSSSVVYISYNHETDWTKVCKCLYRWSRCWDGLQVTEYLDQVAKLCEEEGREDLQLLWRIARRGWKVRNSAVWELLQEAILLPET